MTVFKEDTFKFELKMFNPMWTIYLVLFIWTFSLSCSSPLKDQHATMYEVLVKKCPHLENTELQENFNDIFTSTCVDWVQINQSNYLSTDTKNNTACLVLYESILSFCLGLEDQVAYKGLIPAYTNLMNYSLNSICLSNTMRDSLKKPEHNISGLLEPSSCVIQCSYMTEKGMKVKNECILAFYFATFNVDKFKKDFSLLHQDIPKPAGQPANGTQPGLQSAKDDALKIIESRVEGASENKTKIQSEQSQQDKGDILPQKPKETIGNIENIDEGKSVHGAPAEPAIKENFKPKKNNETETARNMVSHEAPPNNVPVAPRENMSVNHQNENLGNIGKVNMAEDKAEDKEGLKKPSNAKGPPETAQAVQADAPPKKAAAETVLEKAKNENLEDANEENLPANAGDGPDQEGFADEEELEREEESIKVEPAVPEDSGQKSSIKKVKPSTVEEESISAFDTGEDDMDGDSYFFSYFTVVMSLVVIGYVGYHNRQKILALVLEGKKGRRCGRPGRRPNSANYHKLDSNLEEAISSSCTKNASNVIY